MKLNWNFQRDGRVLKKIPFIGGRCMYGYFLELICPVTVLQTLVKSLVSLGEHLPWFLFLLFTPMQGYTTDNKCYVFVISAAKCSIFMLDIYCVIM